MSTCSGSVRKSHDEDEHTPLKQKIDDYNFDSASEFEAWSTPPSTSFMSSCTLLHCNTTFSRFLAVPITFVQSRIRVRKEQMNSGQEKLHNTAYLDGMRGLAAFAVFLCHLSYGTWDITHVYGAGEPGEKSENTYLLQLPIVRLFYCGPPMVAIFFVISGYALSCKPLKQMRSRDFDGLMTTLASSVFRRALRLFLPCFISTFLVACLAQLGIYKVTEDFAYDMRAVHEDHPWTAPDAITQLLDWMHKMLDFVNLFDWSLYSGSIDLDRHLWTIPVEMRCSMALFLTHVLVARMSSRRRILTMGFLIGWATYWNRWEWAPFLAGCVLAELDLREAAKEDTLSLGDVQESKTLAKIHSFWWKYVCWVTFVAGLYLASYPDADGHITPGYVTLTSMIPERYTEKHRFWANIGAVMIVWSASNLELIRRIFTSSPLQWLGKISFPLYILHGPVIHTFGYMAMDKTWESIGGYDDFERFKQGYVFAALLIVAVTLWVSDIFLRVVDTRCVRFARWLEGRFFAP
ncbi:hypothetical protein H2198_008382 [Neophaeococcomyces mojaviensis]|uniref:Uncharacterized protein n=1 Tax=Neophaeococcomyces mojaviensis TaxID=3383035 RepID=A0ACC2ZXH5_9EURO|nr:hypothetical protein H2198_008382 [Knufia sp. JES_112]